MELTLNSVLGVRNMTQSQHENENALNVLDTKESHLK